MQKRDLDRIGKRAQRIAGWLENQHQGMQMLRGDGYRRAASVHATPGWLRDERARELRRLLTRDLPQMMETIREHNLRGHQGMCVYCGEPLRLVRGPHEGLYVMYRTPEGVLYQDPNCSLSPDGHHDNGT